LFTGSKLNDLVITGFFVIWDLKNAVFYGVILGLFGPFLFFGG